MLRGRIACILLAIAICLAIGSVNAEEYSLTDSYSSTDVVQGSDNPNVYRIHSSDGDSITYSFTVQGDGTIEVLFVKGVEMQIINNYYVSYYVAYSTSAPQTSYQNTFPSNPDEGTEFSIFVITESSGNVTYKVSIDSAQPEVDSGFGTLIFYVGGGIAVIVIAILVVKSQKKKTPQYPCAKCGSPLSYNQNAQTYTCGHCGTVIPPSQPSSNKPQIGQNQK